MQKVLYYLRYRFNKTILIIICVGLICLLLSIFSKRKMYNVIYDGIYDGIYEDRMNYLKDDMLQEVTITFLNSGVEPWNEKHYNVVVEQRNVNDCSDFSVSSVFYPIQKNVKCGESLTMMGYMTRTMHGADYVGHNRSNVCKISFRMSIPSKRKSQVRRSAPIFSFTSSGTTELPSETVSNRLKVLVAVFMKRVMAARYPAGKDIERPLLEAWKKQRYDFEVDYRISSGHIDRQAIVNPSLVWVSGLGCYLAAFRWRMSGIPELGALDNIAFIMLNRDLKVNRDGAEHILHLHHNGVRVRGEDPRLYWSKGKLFVTYNYIELADPKLKVRHIRYVQIDLRTSLESPLLHTKGPIVAMASDALGDEVQKNWMPIADLTDTTRTRTNPYSQLFVHTYDPLRIIKSVLRPAQPSDQDLVIPQLVNVVLARNSSPPLASIWQFGHIRGGTPFIHYNSTHQLTLFHSSKQMSPEDPRLTYFMGALLLQTDPFRVAAISRYPLIGKGWYSGYMNSIYYDYVNFPAGILLLNDSTLIVSYGRQDFDGHVALFNMSHIMHLLVVIP